MKKSKSVFLSIIAIIFGVFCFVGCGGTGGASTTSSTSTVITDAQVVGTYSFFKKETESTTFAVGSNYFGDTLTANSMRLTVNSNRTFILSEIKYGETRTRTGAWAVVDGKLTLYVKDVAIMAGTLDGNTLIFESFNEKTILKK